MTKIYLEPGQEFTQSGGHITVGLSGKHTDTGINWDAVARHNVIEDGEGDVNDGHVGQVVASGYRYYREPSFIEERLTFDVYLEKESGRFYYNDSFGS